MGESGARVGEHMRNGDLGEGAGAAQSLREEKRVTAVGNLGRERSAARNEIRARVVGVTG
jgi:hypothetical protein